MPPKRRAGVVDTIQPEQDAAFVPDQPAAILSSKREQSIASKVASNRTNASRREANKAALMAKLEQDEALELERLELQQKLKSMETKRQFNEQRYRIATELLDDAVSGACASGAASLRSERLANWVAESQANRQRQPDSHEISEEIRRMRSELQAPHIEPQAHVDSYTSASQLAARKALPRELPMFSGNPEEWPAFYANYQYTNKACGYRPEENLVRLQRCLKGAALDSVRGRLILPESVPQVVETLRRRFGRPELLIQMLIERVQKAPAPRADKLETLITFGNTVQGLCDHIVASSLSEHLNNPCLLQSLINKLPADYRMRWAAFSRGASSADMKVFAAFMDEIVEDASRVIPYAPAELMATPRPVHKPEHVRMRSMASLTAASVCPVCQQDHFIGKCPEYYKLVSIQRQEVIKSSKRCNNCLRTGHFSSKCSSTFRCRHCNEKHHTSLHMDDPDANGPNGNRNSTSQPPQQERSIVANHKARKQVELQILGTVERDYEDIYLISGQTQYAARSEVSNMHGVGRSPARVSVSHSLSTSDCSNHSEQSGDNSEVNNNSDNAEDGNNEPSTLRQMFESIDDSQLQHEATVNSDSLAADRPAEDAEAAVVAGEENQETIGLIDGRKLGRKEATSALATSYVIEQTKKLDIDSFHRGLENFRPTQKQPQQQPLHLPYTGERESSENDNPDRVIIRPSDGRWVPPSAHLTASRCSITDHDNLANLNTSKDHHLSFKGEYNKSMQEYLDLGHMRNVTCYWTIRLKVVPTCKHAMVVISLESEHMALVKRFIANINKTARAVPAWSDCTGQRDHFIFYDGSSTNDPVLAKYCGGKWLPRIVSKGPEMLIAFHSNPFSVPLQSGQSIRDFNQDVGILFADSDSFDFAQGDSKIEFHINASNPDKVPLPRRGRIGHLHSPRHTSAPNTTCTYHIHGMPADLVGITFTQNHLQILQPSSGSAGGGDNSTIGRSDPLPSITRTHVWDSVGTFVPVRTISPANILSSSSLIGPSLSYGSTISGGATSSIPGMTAATALFHLMSQIVNNYYTAGNQNGMKINISVHFDEVYYHAAYDFIQVPECHRRLRLRDSGHEDDLHFPLRSHDVSCDGLSWYIEAQQQDRSLLVRTWTIFLPLEPAFEYFAKYNARNRLIVYESAPLKVMRVICPLAPSSRSASQHIFSEYWSNNQPFLSFYRPVSMVLEPIHKEPHSIGFSWLKIERTNASFIQQLDLQTNFTANDTLVDFGLYPRETEFEYRCPELDVCIGSALWCHGRSNCTYGYHECEQEYGSHPIELPAAIYAAFCCAAAAISAYLIFYLLLMVKKRHKASEKLKSSARAASLHATLSRKEYKKQSLFFYTGSCYGLQPFEYIHVDRETTV